jgi:hypothetical protein
MYSVQLQKLSQISIHKKVGKVGRKKKSLKKKVKRVTLSMMIMDNLKAEITVMKLKILL